MTNLVQVRGLCKSYGEFQLGGVSFDVPSGYICGFIGPNGAGKTTTLKLILNVISADAGSVRLFGESGTPAHNERIGVVMDYPLYVEDWTLADVEAAVAPFYSKWSANEYAKYLNRFGLERKKRVKELSRGMKIKLQIAVALSHDAQLLLLDEPTSGLDPVARDEICDLLREFVADERRGVLFSTHITTDLDKTADYITFIMDGRIVFTGARDELLGKYARVAGGANELSAEQRRLIIGYREHGTGFEGMAETDALARLPRTVMTEQITLDEIVIFMNKGGRTDE